MLESAPRLFPLPWTTGLRPVSGAITLITPMPALPTVITGRIGLWTGCSWALGPGTVGAGAAVGMVTAAGVVAAAGAVAAVVAATGVAALMQGVELMAAGLVAA